MAKVTAQATGGDLVRKEADTIADLKSQMGIGANYTSMVNGEPATDDYELSDYEQVEFALNAKGAQIVLRKQGALAYR